MYYFEEISLRNKLSLEFIISVIKIVLVTTSRVLLNANNAEGKSREVKEKVTNCLKDTVKIVTTKRLNRSLFNVGHKEQGQFEMQVRDSYLCYSFY